MTTPAKKPYRVVQWATGNVGSRALRQALEHPDLQVVGAWVHSASKVGKDVGELAGVAPIGAKAVGSLTDVLALKPDCVLYMPHVCDFDEVCAILESGANIVSTRMELQNPVAFDPAIAERIEAACQKGHSSVHATGSSPGSIQRRFDHLQIDEFADCSSRDSPEMLFQMMGFGAQPGAASAAQLHHKKMSFGPSLQLVATAIGLPIDHWEVSGAQGLARQDVHIVAGVVPKGTVAATKSTLTGLHKGKPVMTMQTTWFVSDDVETSDGKEWEFRSPSGWHLVLQGDCPLDLAISFPCAPEDYADMTPGLTANRPVNAVTYVVEAAPGIKTAVDLPQIIARLG
jgi:2,4-diaminopentanoate dehydrogenase